jgi:hypothetical protein
MLTYAGGTYSWRHGSINISGHLRVVGEEGALLRGSFILTESSSGSFEGVTCESEKSGLVRARSASLRFAYVYVYIYIYKYSFLYTYILT